MSERGRVRSCLQKRGEILYLCLLQNSTHIRLNFGTRTLTVYINVYQLPKKSEICVFCLFLFVSMEFMKIKVVSKALWSFETLVTITRNSVTSQKTCMFSSTSVRISNLAISRVGYIYYFLFRAIYTFFKVRMASQTDIVWCGKYVLSTPKIQ
jgi:hypothetical protein